MSIVIKQLTAGGYDHNFSYLLYDNISYKGAIVDPTGDINLLLQTISDLNLTPEMILLTHTHFDHTDGIAEILKTYPNLHIYVHERGREAISQYANLRFVNDYDEIVVGQSALRIIYTPGHSDDAICFYIVAKAAADNVSKVITGDTLFVGGCGRTSETRVKDLYESLQELKALPPETVIYPGHDYGLTPTSTLGHEIAHNKYYLAKNFNEFRKLRLGK